MLPILLPAGPLYDFMVGVLLGSTTFTLVSGVKTTVKSSRR